MTTEEKTVYLKLFGHSADVHAIQYQKAPVEEEIKIGKMIRNVVMSGSRKLSGNTDQSTSGIELPPHSENRLTVLPRNTTRQLRKKSKIVYDDVICVIK